MKLKTETGEDIYRTFEPIYYEYECAGLCTEDGCMGHTTNDVVGFSFNGYDFYLEQYMRGDFPGSDKEEVKDVKITVDALEAAVAARRL